MEARYPDPPGRCQAIVGQAPQAGRLTAKCGFGYQGQCCCECALHLVAKPRCHHLGGKGACGPKGADNVLDHVAAEVDHAHRLEDQGLPTYVCLAIAGDGIALTDWKEHGSCELWTQRRRSE